MTIDGIEISAILFGLFAHIENGEIGVCEIDFRAAFDAEDDHEIPEAVVWMHGCDFPRDLRGHWAGRVLAILPPLCPEQRAAHREACRLLVVLGVYTQADLDALLAAGRRALTTGMEG